MKAPDKIYLNAPKETYCSLEPLEVATWDTKEFEDCTNIPYVRKDVLLEWAKENRDSLSRLSYGEFIEKIESL